MLIAVGLSTAVIIGVPVLLYAIDTMSYSTHLQTAQIAAGDIFNATERVDIGEADYLTIQVYIPTGMSMNADGSTLTISILINDQYTSWSESYDHQIVIDNSPSGGDCVMIFRMESNVIYINYYYITH